MRGSSRSWSGPERNGEEGARLISPPTTSASSSPPHFGHLTLDVHLERDSDGSVASTLGLTLRDSFTVAAFAPGPTGLTVRTRLALRGELVRVAATRAAGWGNRGIRTASQRGAEKQTSIAGQRGDRFRPDAGARAWMRTTAMSPDEDAVGIGLTLVAAGHAFACPATTGAIAARARLCLGEAPRRTRWRRGGTEDPGRRTMDGWRALRMHATVCAHVERSAITAN